jgi:hypothetical protein
MTDDARFGFGVECPRRAAFQSLVERPIEEHLLVNFTKHVVHSALGDIGSNAEALNRLQHPALAAPFDCRFHPSGSNGDASIVNRPIARQPLDNGIDFLQGKLAAAKSVAQLASRKLSS